MHGLKRWIGATLVFALFASPALLDAQEVPECEIQTDLTVLPVSEEPVSLIAVYSDAIGEEIAAEFAEESGVQIVAIEEDPEDALTVVLTLDTSAAAAGDWELAFEGEGGRCVGQVAVVGDTGLQR